MNQYDHLKNKLHNYKVDIDKDKLWENTSHAIPQRKRRPAILIMLFAGLVISGWLLHSTSLLPLSESRSALHSTQIDNHDPLAQNLQDIPSETSTPSQETPNNTIEVLSSKLSRSVTKLISSKNPTGSDYISKPKTKGENIFLSESENGNIEKQNVQVVDPVIPAQQEGSFVIIHQKENDFSNTDHAANGPVDYLFKAVSQIPMTTNSVAATGSHSPIIRSQKDQLLQSFQMVQGVGFSSVKIHSLTPESAQLAAQLEQKMRSLEILSTSATATINLPEKFSLETGLQLTRLSTVIDHEWETIERIQQEGVSTIIIDENGIPQSITGSADVTRTTHYYAKRFTAHQNIDIVLALHRVIWNAQCLSLHAFVKGGYNLSYQAKGTILTYNGELIGFSKDDNPFRRNSLFTIGGGLQMNYQLSPHWNLASSLTFDQLRYQFKDSTIPLRFQHSGLSLGLGIGYVF